MFAARDDACTQRACERNPHQLISDQKTFYFREWKKLQQLFCRLILGVNYLHIIVHKKYPTWNEVKWRQIRRKTSNSSVSWFWSWIFFYFCVRMRQKGLKVNILLFKQEDYFNFFSFFKIFGGHKSFSWGHWYPSFGLLVACALGFKARVDHFCMISHLCDPQIHLWCDTSWLYCVEVSMAAEPFLSKYHADVSASIGGGSRLEPTTFCAIHSKHSTVYYSATPARHYFNFWPFFFLNRLQIMVLVRWWSNKISRLSCVHFQVFTHKQTYQGDIPCAHV